jgi:hypothetical protein
MFHVLEISNLVEYLEGQFLYGTGIAGLDSLLEPDISIALLLDLNAVFCGPTFYLVDLEQISFALSLWFHRWDTF